MSWSYEDGDAGIQLFTASLAAGAPMAFTPGMRVLEAACCEEDWLQRAAKTWPECHFTGVDQAIGDKVSRGPNWIRFGADLLNPDAFVAETFDAVVSLSAIEHIGLGHYGDRKDPDGDSKAIANIWKWLKPGGFLYFDVPYDPTGYRVLNTECRIYDDVAIANRLSMSVTRGDVWAGMPVTLSRWVSPVPGGPYYSDSKSPGTLVEKPTVAAPRYWYVAMCWRKA